MPFDDDIAVHRAGVDHYRCEISPAHQIIRGPNGGYLAAILTRAGDVHLDDPTRTLRSLTTHFLRPPEDGPATLEVTTEQQGRSVTYLRIKMFQNGKNMLLGTGVWATQRSGPDYRSWSAPEVPGPDDSVPIGEMGDSPKLAIHDVWDIRNASGHGFGQGAAADVCWWIRPAVHRALDNAMIVAMSDALPPPIFVTDVGRLPVPTLDLTVHIRSDLSKVAWREGDWVLTRFSTRFAADGFLEEDGELFAADGTPLAHSRQLALAVPGPE
ncbi:MAG: thioesterase family protein [Myxococcota bacterium]|jgi:acyl-CoA thioesterase|nr:thioesterase family protein [Myxococcota bacterium]